MAALEEDILTHPNKDPEWLLKLDRAMAAGEHVLLVFNVDDWHLDPEELLPPLRLPERLAHHFQGRGIPAVRWTIGSGVEILVPPSTNGPPRLNDRLPTGRTSAEALPSLTTLLRSSAQRVVVIVDYADSIVPLATGGALDLERTVALETIHWWGLDAAIRAARNHVILISRHNQINEVLRRSNSYRTIEIPLPDRDQRLHAIRLVTGLHKEGRGDLAPPADGTSAESLADISGGLQIDDLLKLSREAAARKTRLDEHTVTERKKEALAAQGHELLEVHDPSFGFDGIAGLDHVKDELNSCIATDLWPPGLLFVGPPGIGKSLMAEALAFERGCAMASMREIRSPWVGVAESNLERVLWIIDSLAPVVVRLDEIDQMLGQRGTGPSGDSGVSERLLARLWEFMGETVRQRRVLWIGTSNRPDLLDAATIDRFPGVFPFLPPGAEDVAALFPKLASQIGRRLADDVDLEEISAHSKLRLTTGRTLLDILRRASVWSDIDEGSSMGDDGRHEEETPATIGHAQLIEAIEDHRPNLDPDLNEFLALTALSMTTSKSLLPWRHRGGRRESAALLPYVEKIMSAEMELNEDALRARLFELSRILRERGKL